MQRDKRVQDNWALIYAQDLALKNKVPLYVCFTYLGKFKDANIRQYQFLFDGLKETSEKLNRKNIPFYLLKGNPIDEISKFIEFGSTHPLLAYKVLIVNGLTFDVIWEESYVSATASDVTVIL